jgi:hypothetical protein
MTIYMLTGHRPLIVYALTHRLENLYPPLVIETSFD